MADISDAEFLRRAVEARSRIREEPTEVALRPGQEKQTLVDVRGADEYAQGHLGGAVNLPLDQLSEQVASPKQVASELNATVVCYCNGGNRGALATDALRHMGHSNVVNLAGGFNTLPDSVKRGSIEREETQ
ncbi:rhodanese-like domain-containing protein [Nesterenkonia haasae]|uniref:rhodanese-like domain-containing protein n=1 Tax=Nesterenkonia haasae TaxID=2587813 RepID=UPI0013919F08|nr:rhodanese-like domain-containing protein [Nesterenkonia haasae]NDK31118.1 rhodanese-like domain-containing protein [Nesterenkonia haasae]